MCECCRGLLTVVDDIFCSFQAHPEGVALLKQQYGLNETTNEVTAVIEAHRTPRDWRPYAADRVMKDITGKFAFVLLDSPPETTFLAADVGGSVPFFWGSDCEGNLVPSDDAGVINKGCGKLLHHSLEDASSSALEVCRVMSLGRVRGTTFKVVQRLRRSLTCLELGVLRTGPRTT